MNCPTGIEEIKVSVVQVFKFYLMGKYYENLDNLIELIKKLDKKNSLAEFILDCIKRTKENPDAKIHDIIKESKKRWCK